MQAPSLYSSPKERYSEHIRRCRERFDTLFPIYSLTLLRTLGKSLIERETLKDSLLKMILFHDLGKLTRKWQENVGKNRALPPHSSIGAAYLWNVLPSRIKEPVALAVCIHHTDRGLLGDNIEKPDIEVIVYDVVDGGGNVAWHDEVRHLGDDYFPKEVHDISVYSLRDMARGLRSWARGCSLLEQHQRRLQASILHHILKLCDISAASEREEYRGEDEKKDYYGGWLMLENIKNYMESISKRRRNSILKAELNRLIEVLKKKYNPKEIFLFGSFAQGMVKEWSDIDLIVIKETEKPFLDRIKDVLSILCPKVGLDVFVYTPEEFKDMCNSRMFFKREVNEKGVKVYERRAQEVA